MSPAPIGIGLMCKPPRPGASKTRLAAALGDASAAVLARAFLADTAATVSRAAVAHDLVKKAYYRPADAAAEIAGVIVPTLPERNLAEAAAILRSGDDRTAVIGPSADGGYYLLGIRGPAAAPLLEPMAWSTAGVLSETRRRAGHHGIRLVEVDRWYDIDEAGDLDRIGVEDDAPAAATRATLAALVKARSDG